MPNRILTATEVRQSLWEATGHTGPVPPAPPRKDPSTGPWEVQVKGERCSKCFEITVIRKNNEHGHASWGWINENNLLICHNGGPCHDALIPMVWDRMVQLAHEVADELNRQGSLDTPSGRPASGPADRR